MKKILFYTLLLVGISACERDVPNAKLPSSATQLVVGCFISPQDVVLKATVTTSVSILGNSNWVNTSVQDATVTLAEGNRSVTLTFDADEKAYLADAKNFPIVEGKTYTLRVTTPSGFETEAACTVPATLDTPVEVNIESPKSNNSNEYLIRMQWQDPAGEENYYRVAGSIKSIPSEQQPNLVDWGINELITDKSRDGKRLSSPKGSFSIPPPAYAHSVTLHAYLLHIDRHYYAYHQSLQNASAADNNPFAEPVHIYTNVQGGLGIFAAYTQTTTEIKIK